MLSRVIFLLLLWVCIVFVHMYKDVYNYFLHLCIEFTGTTSMCICDIEYVLQCV